MSKKQEYCYMCGKRAVSREHVPPLALFPEKKDVDFIDLRQNLVTVPSCDLHNSKKSKDDEFLVACMAGVVGNNKIGYLQNKTKVKRMFERYGEHFIHVISKNPEFLNLKTPSGTIYPIAKGTPDYPRLIRCFEHIAYGLYYNKFDKVFDGEIKIRPAFINYNNAKNNSFLEIISRRFVVHQNDDEAEKFGNNPLVFQYWIVEPDEYGIIGMKLTFYGGADVYVAFIPSNFRLPEMDLLNMFIKSGIAVNVTFNDGKPPVKFN